VENSESMWITPLRDNIFHIAQKATQRRFSSCDGLLCLPDNYSTNQVDPLDQADKAKPIDQVKSVEIEDPIIVLDLNLETPCFDEIIERFHLNQAPKIEYYVSHGHMDHIANVWQWERLGANIHLPAPYPSEFLTDSLVFLSHFRFAEYSTLESGHMLCSSNSFHPCKRPAHTYIPGEPIRHGKWDIQTLPLFGHGQGHTGFFFPRREILHMSCLGYDLRSPDDKGFGPWYGFPDCSLPEYWKNIADMEQKFLIECQDPILTTSHATVLTEKTAFPFTYMREKIISTHQKIRDISKTHGLETTNEVEWVKAMIPHDPLFPKKKMRPWLKDIYGLWETWHLKHHFPYIEEELPKFT